MPRELTEREREVLEFLVSIDDPAAHALRAQAATAQVTGECKCGCGAIELDVDRERTPPVAVSFPIESFKDDRDDPEACLWLMLWATDGWISGIEIAWLSEDGPQGLPSPEGFDQPKPQPPRSKPPSGSGRTSKDVRRFRWNVGWQGSG